MGFEPQGPTDDMSLARLPFRTAQALLLAAPVRDGAAVRLMTEWHGTDTDPERGSFVLVREGSEWADTLLGERLRITYFDRSVFAYCHQTADLDDDVSVTRRLYGALTTLSTTSLPVLVEVVA